MGAFETIELALKLRDEATSKLEKQRIVWGRLKLAAVAAATAFAAFIARGVKFNAQVERATVQFRAFFASAESAEAHVRSLADFAAKTPFQLPGILQASRMLLTFAADAAFGADTLRIVGDAAAGVSAPIEEVSTWFGRMYTAIQAGRPMGEALQRLQELGLLSGVARTKMEDLSKAGADQEQVMAVLRAEWAKHEGAMERLSGTTEGLESTFGDLISQVAGATASMLGADDAYKKFLETSNQVLTGTLDMMNGVRDLDAEIVSLKQEIAQVNPDFGGPWTLDNLARLEAELADLQNQRFWEQFTADQEAAAAAGKPIIEEVVPAWEVAGHKSAEAYAKALKKEAKEALAAFWDEAEKVQAGRAQASAFGLKEPAVQEAIRAAGSNAGLEWAVAVEIAAFMGGPGGLMHTIPKDMMSIAEDGSFTLAGAAAGEELGEGLSAWARGGGLSGMFTGMTGAISAFATGGWQGGLTSMLNTAASFLPPGMAQVAQAALAAVSAVWSAIKRPSEAEIQARKTFESMHQIAVTELGGIAEYQDQVSRLMADGWDRTLAETVAGFEHWGAQAGIAHDYVIAKYAEYQAAVKAGDADRMAAIEAEVDAWKAAADEKNRIAEQASQAAMAAFYAARDAGIQAYDETLQAAIEAGLGEEEATAKALAAQIAASEAAIAQRKEEFAFDAAINAAMALGAHATADERIAAAEEAARVAMESWDAAMTAVTASDAAATAAIQDNAVETASVGAAESARMADAATAEYNRMAAGMAAAAGDIQGSIDSIKGKTVDVRVNHHTRYTSSGSSDEPSGTGGEGEARALGGPVSGGRSYWVGELGPELYTPRGSGHITATKDIIDYDRLAAAIAANPPVIAQDDVGSASLRTAPSLRAWRGWS